MILNPIRRFVNNINVRDKLFIAFVLVVFAPVVIVGGYLTNELRNQAIAEAEEQVAMNMERVKERTLEILKVPIYISNNIRLDYQLENILNKNYESTFQLISDYWEYDNFQEYIRTYHSEISNLRFYVDNPNLINDWEIIPASAHIKEKNWFKTALENGGAIQWNYIRDETKSNEKYLSLVRKIDFSAYKTSGVLVINVNSKTLKTILSQESSMTMLVDGQNNIIASNSEEQIGHKLDRVTDMEEVLKGDTGIFHDTKSKEPRRIFVQNVPLDALNKLFIISIIEDQEIVKNAHQFGKMGTILMSITILVAVILIYILAKLFSTRIILLSKQISNVSKGDFNMRINIDGKDEIGQLANDLDQMVINTKNLLQKIEKSNRQKALLEKKQSEIKFKMLASQINPHFLFNCLESIRMEAHFKGETEIAEVVKLLGKLMRNNLEVSEGRVELQKEVDVTKWYLDIQKFRYEDRLNYYFNIEPSTEKLLIPPLIIQPLVENSVIHGLEDVRNGGEVRISTKLKDNRLFITVSDDGTGISRKRLIEISRTLSDNEDQQGVRIGLRNVYQRLKLVCGEDSELKIESEEGKGTTVSLSIFLGVGGENIVESDGRG
ncbi:two-component system, sensor histidine kinase YesM [Gracilibacillus ureilyticus]|uniref:histidine kinase n=1 Tax=Gracilibacillus ureilyticus TaxID=531814 RepID=A0A1H9PL09_9BACI|nr:sensor histidine kinase [Gracilibacillus ureilyticus]SER48858.1 two-component system, sensor histidine kinase YesM [Gracilibacillus ureilyticus]